ncbi:unnamed protein product [Protopolystoma xenopodis]|uniref:Uncharacterized protein n=1 Tax=Protopolystoma xenopodis TaxID=117903 RepID=A0A3S5CK48_9PLAT|nr:unnamed protein product [Protopolystoma xenopodis]
MHAHKRHESERTSTHVQEGIGESGNRYREPSSQTPDRIRLSDDHFLWQNFQDWAADGKANHPVSPSPAAQTSSPYTLAGCWCSVLFLPTGYAANCMFFCK